MTDNLYKASQSPYRHIGSISTGIPQVDRIIGPLKGVPLCRITEVSGPHSVGKTTFICSIITQAQKAGLRCVFADVENSLDFDHIQKLGVDLDKLMVVHDSHAEAYLDTIEDLVANKKVDLAIIDSIGALAARAELEKAHGERVIGAQANVVAKFTRKITPLLAQNNVALVVINHIVVDIMTGAQKTSGGEKLAFAKSLAIKMSPAGQQYLLKRGDKVEGQKIKFKIMKNKVGPRFQECEATLLYDSGWSGEADLLMDALEKGVIKKEGNTYTFNGTKIGVGAGKVRDALKDEKLAEEVQKAL